MEKKQHINCIYCGMKETVTITTKNTTQSISMKIGRCLACKKQSGVKVTLNALYPPIFINL